MDAFIGEIRGFCFQFPPRGWLYCDGTEYAVRSYQALYSLIGNIYGGTLGQTFKVPDLVALAVVGSGSTAPAGLTLRSPGTKYGEPSVMLGTGQSASHSHVMQQAFLPAAAAINQQIATPSSTTMIGHVTTTAAGNCMAPVASGTKVANLNGTGLNPAQLASKHNNMQPFLSYYFAICADGNYPDFND